MRLTTFNEWLTSVGGHITLRVGTMWAAIVFAILAFISLPAAIASGNPVIIIGWVAQTFLQLVLLPIIMVGQNVQGAATQKLIQETHDTVMGEHAEIKLIVASIHAAVTK